MFENRVVGISLGRAIEPSKGHQARKEESSENSAIYEKRTESEKSSGLEKAGLGESC